MIPLKEYVKQCCTKTRALRVKTTENKVLYEGAAAKAPDELLQADWLVKMMEIEKGSVTITVIKEDLI